MFRSRPPQPSSRPTAFTLVELVVVIVILAIIAGIAVPSTLAFVQQAHEQALVTQVQQVFDDAQLFHARNGRWSDNVAHATFPADFAGMLPESLFTDPPPLGDHYDWNGPGTGAPFIGVRVANVAHRARRSIDAGHDDGDGKAGWIESRGSTLHFRLAPK